jgi:hypothetical protein
MLFTKIELFRQLTTNLIKYLFLFFWCIRETLSLVFKVLILNQKILILIFDNCINIQFNIWYYVNMLINYKKKLFVLL